MRKLIKNDVVRSSFLTVFRHNVKNEDLTLRLLIYSISRPRASLCCANSPENWALYAVSVRLPVRYTQTGRLIALHSRLPLPLVALACGSPYASLQPFRPRLAAIPLPSAIIYANKS